MALVHTSSKSGFIRRSGGRRRESLWFSIPAVRTTDAAAGAATIISSLTVAALSLRPFTIVRTRMEILAVSDQTGAVEDYQAGIGLAVVSDQAVAAGITAVPLPFSDLGSDLWFAIELIFGQFVFVSGIGFQDSTGVHRTLDSKAMRKVEDGQDIIITSEASALSDGYTVVTAGRMLVKLH